MSTKTFAETAGLPEKNVTHVHSDPAKNDVEDIIKAIYTKLEVTEEPTNGHSPMDRLVVAVAKLHDVDPTTALSTGNYPNQTKRIAAIIRGDFGEQ